MKKLSPIFFKTILFIFLSALLGWIFYINNRHENVLEVSLQLQASRDSLAKVNQKKKPDTTVITTEKKIDKEKIQIYAFHEGLAMASYKNKFGFVNKRKQVVAHFQYDAVEDFSEGMAGVSINSLWGFIDRKGIIAIPLKYDYVSYFSEGMAGFKIGEIWGFMDKNGKEIIEPKYETIQPFKKGKAQVSIKKRKFFYIDKQGKCIKECENK